LETNPLLKLLAELKLEDLTEEERRKILNGEPVYVSTDEMLIRRNGTASFK